MAGAFMSALACATAGAACSGATAVPRIERSSVGAPASAAPSMGNDSSAPAAPAEGNPFAGATFDADPAYAARVESTRAAAPEHAANLLKLETVPTAVWLDSIAGAQVASRSLDPRAVEAGATDATGAHRQAGRDRLRAVRPARARLRGRRVQRRARALERRRSPLREGLHRAPGRAVSRASVAAHRRGARARLPRQPRHEPGGRAVRGRRGCLPALDRARGAVAVDAQRLAVSRRRPCGLARVGAKPREDRADLPRRARRGRRSGQGAGLRDQRLQLRPARRGRPREARAVRPVPRRAHVRRKARRFARRGGHHGQGRPDRYRPQWARRHPHEVGELVQRRRRRPRRAPEGLARTRSRRVLVDQAARRLGRSVGARSHRLRRELRARCSRQPARCPPAGHWFPAQLLQLIDRANPPL